MRSLDGGGEQYIGGHWACAILMRKYIGEYCCLGLIASLQFLFIFSVSCVWLRNDLFPALADVPCLPCCDGLLSLWNQTPPTSHLNQLLISCLWSQYLSWITSVNFTPTRIIRKKEPHSRERTFIRFTYRQVCMVFLDD